MIICLLVKEEEMVELERVCKAQVVKKGGKWVWVMC